jgi:hypothetical protein
MTVLLVFMKVIYESYESFYPMSAPEDRVTGLVEILSISTGAMARGYCVFMW